MASALIAFSLILLVIIGLLAIFFAGKSQKSASMDDPEKDDD